MEEEELVDGKFGKRLSSLYSRLPHWGALLDEGSQPLLCILVPHILTHDTLHHKTKSVPACADTACAT
jgi:hypothetical protein